MSNATTTVPELVLDARLKLEAFRDSLIETAADEVIWRLIMRAAAELGIDEDSVDTVGVDVDTDELSEYLGDCTDNADEGTDIEDEYYPAILAQVREQIKEGEDR